METKKSKHSDAGRMISKAILEQYRPTNQEEMQDALKDIFGPMFKAKVARRDGRPSVV